MAARTAASYISSQAEDNIKSRLRKSGETGHNPREYVIDTSSKGSIQAMDNVSKESWADEVIIVECSWQSLDFCVVVVHGSNDHIERRVLWCDLLRYASGCTVFIGDFNAVKGAHERRSSIFPLRASCLEFGSFIDDTHFIESPTEGLRFTCFSSSHFGSLTVGFTVSSSYPYVASSLQIFKHVGAPSHFMDMVSGSWSTPVNTLCPILSVMLKLKNLRACIRVWNKEVFGNVDSSIARLHNQLMDIQKIISETGYTDDLFDVEISIQAELNVTLTRKNSLLQQKSRVTWLQDGDRNTTFFHRIAKFKKRNAPITRLSIDGVDEYDPGIIEQHIVDHFVTLFTDDGNPLADSLEIEAYLKHAVTEEQNRLLVRIPDESEIVAAVFGMDVNSAPGPDGFSGMFFQKCWSIIKNDVILVVHAFFHHSYLPNGCNSNTMILIPNKDTVDTVSDLLPIVLSNFFFNIISKIMASRLNVVAASHVSPNQFGFISGRNIHDCIMLSSEGFNCMHRTNRGLNMACKIDIRKAFDTIRWGFIMQVLRATGYHESFIQWVQIIFASARLSILYNGNLSGYFACSRGVRQGDPLSPILFGIAEDVLSSIFQSCVESCHLAPMGFSRTRNFPTHLFYADDIILFCKATVRNACKIQEILNYYGSISGQHCSTEKSNIFFARRVPTDRRRAIHRVLPFSIGSRPTTYLGVPISVGRTHASFFMPIYDRIVQKFARWKGIQLSIAGRLCLVKSIIQSSMVHSIMVYKWPKSLLHALDRKCRNFVWSGNVDKKPTCVVSWGRACSPKEEGGLGIRSFTLMNQSYLMKLAWKMIKGADWAHQLIRSRYLTKFGYAKPSIANFPVWVGVKHEIDQLMENTYSCISRGDNTYFWRDNWLGYTLVDKLKIPHYMHDYLNFSVQDYFYDGVWHFSASFVNRFPEVVADILLVLMSGEADSLYWKHSVRGDILTALAFSNKCHCFPKVKWGTWIWEPFIPVRRSILCWRVIHGRLPTLDILIRQGFSAPNGCLLCFMGAESISHLMWECTKIRLLWKELLLWFEMDHLWECIDIHAFLVAAWNAPFSSRIRAFWKAGIISLMWKIWDCRNLIIFENASFDGRSVLAFVKGFFKEIDNISLNMGNSNSSWNDYIVSRNLGVNNKVAPPPRMIEVHWWPPVLHWIKVNTDGSALGTPGLIAAGGVFRDNWAVVRGCFHIKGGVGEGNQPADIMANNDRREGWWPFAIEEIRLAVSRDMSTHSHFGFAGLGVWPTGRLFGWLFSSSNCSPQILNSWIVLSCVGLKMGQSRWCGGLMDPVSSSSWWSRLFRSWFGLFVEHSLVVGLRILLAVAVSVAASSGGPDTLLFLIWRILSPLLLVSVMVFKVVLFLATKSHRLKSSVSRVILLDTIGGSIQPVV
ncbi:uncharacterized protein LOC130998382 [Salvia miltiorrhiza]|uniref:uncharacterized protein LOC130998382 n=1 Tax=Salvia miltiorrhiza TaxID=226208 RepID=UPI0025AC37B3|nr:uncharacterized protein LOC130998382 [Salvia miltiorrhiza]